MSNSTAVMWIMICFYSVVMGLAAWGAPLPAGENGAVVLLVGRHSAPPFAGWSSPTT